LAEIVPSHLNDLQQARLCFSDYRALWPIIRPHIERLLAGSIESLIPEDVYCALAQETAQLWASVEGFVITRARRCPDSGAKSLLVWFAAAYDGRCSGLQLYDGQLDEIARAAGAVYVTMCSARKGFERALPQGWAPQHVVWRREVR
jgi:hypothetical protein